MHFFWSSTLNKDTLYSLLFTRYFLLVSGFFLWLLFTTDNFSYITSNPLLVIFTHVFTQVTPSLVTRGYSSFKTFAQIIALREQKKIIVSINIFFAPYFYIYSAFGHWTW